ncbi:hypothetical protein RJ639_031098 [Escallonia herrerae]|uniref:Small auxin up regulated protein n=1 Tax=Escallonia herrerae TaxID=1293975 RepID=A0AA89BIF9_9ASTE|nr:hypothetical protein RJ639_031098 [Escallonia herrerae]
MNTVSHSNVISPSLGCPNSSSDILNSSLKMGTLLGKHREYDDEHLLAMDISKAFSTCVVRFWIKVRENHLDNINKKSDNTSVTLAVLAYEAQISMVYFELYGFLSLLFSSNSMISTKTLARMVRKWQNLVTIRRKRISLPRHIKNAKENSSGTQLLADKGHFVVYSEDVRRFVIPLVYLNNEEVLIQLLTLSEEEFGLPGDGHITLPCDAFLMEYIISLIQRGLAEHLEKALLTSVFGSRSMSSSNLHQGQSSQQL